MLSKDIRNFENVSNFIFDNFIIVQSINKDIKNNEKKQIPIF